MDLDIPQELDAVSGEQMIKEMKDILDDCGFEFVEIYENKFCKECGSPYIERKSEARPKGRESNAGENFHEAVIEKRRQMEKMGYYYGFIRRGE